MNVDLSLEKVKIPAEFINKTSFLFEVKDFSFIHLGIEPDSIALVDNSRRVSTDYPVAFIFEGETYIGLPKLIAEDLYYLENNLMPEGVMLFSTDITQEAVKVIKSICYERFC